MSTAAGARYSILHLGPATLRIRVRTAAVGAVLAGATVAMVFVALMLGELRLGAGEVASALLGNQSGLTHTVVVEWRLPRALAGALFGAALGLAGAIFQSLTRNPLASPDIIGLSSGAYAGGIAAIILFGGGYLVTAGGALVGAAVAAIALVLLAYRGGVSGFRLIIVGVAISAMMIAISSYLILRARVEVAMTAAVWGAGSLSDIGWGQLALAAVVIVLALLALLGLSRSLRALELGDDAANALGTRVQAARLGLIATAVVLTAATTTAAGPISFIALSAPQVARRLAGTPEVALMPAALLGAALLSACDMVAQHVLPRPLPVGIVTMMVGGVYLIWILLHETRRTR